MIKKLKELPFTSYHPSYEFLAFYRIFFSLFLLWMGVSDYSWISDIPNSAMLPPISPLSFVESIPPKWFFVACKYIMYACLLLILIGFRPRIFAIVFMVTVLITNNYAYSFGKINHNFIYTLPILIMAFSPWNHTYSFFPEPKKETDVLSRSWPIFLISMLFGFGMFTAGFAKYLGGWLSLDTQYSQIFFYRYRYGFEWNKLLSDFYDTIPYPLFWEFFDYFTVLFEVAFIVAFLKPKYFRFMLLLTLLFHLNVLFMLNISFSFAMGLYALFIPADLLPEGFKNGVKKIFRSIFQPRYKWGGIVFVILYIILIAKFNLNLVGFLPGRIVTLLPITNEYMLSIIVIGFSFLLALYLFIRSFKKAY
ncbi:hypothetical protein [Chryseobacterium sp. CT-SW4]|uniref:hypothetical protein n=1 Tax=Chryseobacterium sp. SW-1 TaxID=3157343 RepID=UPI003B0136B5